MFFFGMFGYETHGSKIDSKIVEFCTKTEANRDCKIFARKSYCNDAPVSIFWHGSVCYFLFLKIKKILNYGRFTRIKLDDIKSASLKVLKAILNTEFEKCFGDWKEALAQVHNI